MEKQTSDVDVVESVQEVSGLVSVEGDDVRQVQTEGKNCSETNTIPESISIPGCSTAWWSGLIDTARNKSTEVLELMKRDLSEFATVVQHDTSAIVANTATQVKDRISSLSTPHGEGDGQGGGGPSSMQSVGDAVSSVLSKVANSMYIPPDDDDDENMVIYVPDNKPANKAQARLYAIQLDPDTYLKDADGGYREWVETSLESNLDGHKGRISDLLVSCPHVRQLYTQLVPSQVSHTHFWARYFYKLHLMEEDERRKAALKERAERSVHESMEEGSGEWDDEGDGEDEWSVVAADNGGPDTGDKLSVKERGDMVVVSAGGGGTGDESATNSTASSSPTTTVTPVLHTGSRAEATTATAASTPAASQAQAPQSHESAPPAPVQDEQPDKLGTTTDNSANDWD